MLLEMADRLLSDARNVAEELREIAGHEASPLPSIGCSVVACEL